MHFEREPLVEATVEADEERRTARDGAYE